MLFRTFRDSYLLYDESERCKKERRMLCCPLRGDRRVSLLKYTEGLRTSPNILVTLRLPAEYKHGMFGLLWAYTPLIRPGVFFRCMLRAHSSQKSFCLFEYLDNN